jgi:hypothetical protein
MEPEAAKKVFLPIVQFLYLVAMGKSAQATCIPQHHAFVSSK